MPRIFISYSRVNKAFTDRLVLLLKKSLPNHHIWYDQNIHGGEKWWSEILKQIAKSDIFIYLLSHDSIISAYCKAEFQEAYRLKKRIIPVEISENVPRVEGIEDIQSVDMTPGPDDADALADLVGAINSQIDDIPPTPPEPRRGDPTERPDVPNEDVAPLSRLRSRSLIQSSKWIITGGIVIAAIIVIGTSLQPVDPTATPQPPPDQTQIAAIVETAIVLTQLAAPSIAPPSSTPDLPTLTETPFPPTMDFTATASIQETAKTQSTNDALAAQNAIATTDTLATINAQSANDALATQNAIASISAQSTNDTLAAQNAVSTSNVLATANAQSTSDALATQNAIATTNAQVTSDALATQNALLTPPSDVSIIPKGNTNVREGPGLIYPLLTVGSAITTRDKRYACAIDVSKDWVELCDGGWVAFSRVTFEGDWNTLPVINPTPMPLVPCESAQITSPTSEQQVDRTVRIYWNATQCQMEIQIYHNGNVILKERHSSGDSINIVNVENSDRIQIKIWKPGAGSEADDVWVNVQ